jgi:hypothetical protein
MPLPGAAMSCFRGGVVDLWPRRPSQPSTGPRSTRPTRPLGGAAAVPVAQADVRHASPAEKMASQSTDVGPACVHDEVGYGGEVEPNEKQGLARRPGVGRHGDA